MTVGIHIYGRHARGLDFLRRSVELADKYRQPHQRVLHTIQTNGALIDDEWVAFFKQHNYLVGISIDGPRYLHESASAMRAASMTWCADGIACESTTWTSISYLITHLPQSRSAR